LVGSGLETPAKLRILAEDSARLYPEFVHELEDEAGMKVDLRDHGSILLSSNGAFPDPAEPISLERLQSMEPGLALPGRGRLGRHDSSQTLAAYLEERSVDPRALVTAAVKAARHRQVDISSGAEV